MEHDFSIIVPTRNRPGLCAVALDSILAQDLKNIEIIVVDDGSDDASRRGYVELAARHAGTVRFHHLPRSARGHGHAFARNLGAELTSGGFIGFLDDDDIWTDPRHLSRARQAIVAGGDVDLYLANQNAVSDGRPLTAHIWIEGLTGHVARLTAVGEGYRISAAELLRFSDGFCHLNTTLVRRSLFERIKGFDTGLRYEPDRDFYLRAIDQAASIVFCPAFVATHHAPDTSVSSNASTQTTSIEKSIIQLAILNKALLFSKPPVKAYAVRHKAYTLRKIAELLCQEGDFRTAGVYAREALGVRFTTKWLAFCLYVQIRALAAPRHIRRFGKYYGHDNTV